MFWWEREVVEDEEPQGGASTKPLPAGRVRVEFLDGAFKGRITVISQATADALGDRIRILDLDG